VRKIKLMILQESSTHLSSPWRWPRLMPRQGKVL